MKEYVKILLRVCTRCGHKECPHCRDWCDVLTDDDVCGCFDECTYAEPIDSAGYAALDAASERLEAAARAAGAKVRLYEYTTAADGVLVTIGQDHNVREPETAHRP